MSMKKTVTLLPLNLSFFSLLFSTSHVNKLSSAQRKYPTTFFQIWFICHELYFIFLENCYDKLARFTTKRPFVILLTALSFAILLTFGILRYDFIAEHSKGKEIEDILDWESKFTHKMSSFTKNTTNDSVYYSPKRCLPKSVTDSTGSDIKFLAITITIIATLTLMINCRPDDPLNGKKLLTLAGLLTISLGIASAFGLLIFLRVPFISMAGVLPILVFTLGLNVVFTILHELNDVIDENIPNVTILSSCMARSGPIITMTILTNLVAFVVWSQSVFPTVRHFCLYALLSISFPFLLLITFFAACVWFSIKRIDALRKDHHDTSTSGYPLDMVMKAWARLLTTTYGKLAVCIVSVLLLVGSIYGAIHLDKGFGRQLAIKGSHNENLLHVFENQFNPRIEVSIVVSEQLDYSTSEVQQKYLDLQNIITSNKYFYPVTASWMSEFLHWAKVNNARINETQYFYPSLQRFLALSEYKKFVRDVKFSEDKTYISSSRIVVFPKRHGNSEIQKDMMTSLRRDLSQHSNLDVYALSMSFSYFEQQAEIFDETVQNLITAGVAFMVVTMVFFVHPVIVLVITLGFAALTFELFGLMYICGLSLNPISLTSLVMALGFSVEQSTRVAYNFISSDASSSELRVVHTLGAVGGRVLTGGLATFMGMLAMGFTSSVIFQVFFKMFIGTIVLGLLHSLAILPVHLLILGKLFHFHETSYMDILSTWKNRKLKPVRDKDGYQNTLKHKKVVRKYNPVAVIGISCRFAQGTNSKDAFWNMLVEGKCGISSYPTNRLESIHMKRFYNPGRYASGKHYTLKGAFLDKISGFDAQFFGISPAECRSLDPQQRLLLQVVYEAIEDAGMRLEDLQQCQTGVYVGLMNLDYARLIVDDTNVPKIDEFASTGNAASTVANRISFSLNLTGPSLTVDSACSSSLTALNIAMTHLQTAECDVAIVCAPNLILARHFHTAFCRTGLLAEDGRCKSFDAKGDGYGRGEGIAAVILKKTSHALQDRDDPYAEIVACGLNNDGQNAIPMTAPSDKMQSELARRVLQESGLSKDDIQYVEAHGTGTAVGDVVEMRSVSNVYGNNPARVLRVGSVKSNINHTESTAGLAGLIKVCLMIKHGYFVPTVNVHELKPQLMISERKMMVQVKLEPWETGKGKQRTAAICCYGFGGANGHAIVREIDQLSLPVIHARNRVSRIMTLSARSREALKMMAKRFSSWFELKPDNDELLKDNICYTLNNRRTVHPHRLAVTFHSFNQAANVLRMFADDIPGWHKLASVGDTNVPVNKLAFLYGGQGARWYGMANEMIQHEQIFRESIGKIDNVLQSLGVTWRLTEELTKSENLSRIQENPIGQTALFAVHYSITELLKSWSIFPAAVVGHSLGEISAACAVKAITLKDALQLVLLRSELQESCSSTGRMMAVGMSPEDAANLVRSLQLESRVSVAVINSPMDVVLSGDADSMQAIEDHLQRQHGNVFRKTLGTTRAFHSSEMEEVKSTFMERIADLQVNAGHAKLPFYSTVAGTQISGQMLSRDHWWKNVRETVQFSSAVENMMSDGYKIFVEINAAPQLARYVHQIWSHYQKKKATQETEISVITTLPKSSVEKQHMSFLHNCPATLFTRGYPVSWDKIQGTGSKSFIRCPSYPWQEKEFWYRDTLPPEHVKSLAVKKQVADNVNRSHPLLGKAVSTEAFSGLHAWESEIDLYNLHYLKDHAFQDSDDPVIPAAFYVEMGLAVILHMFPNVTPHLSGLTFNNLLKISRNDILNFRTRLEMNQNFKEESNYQITSRDVDGNEVLLSEGFARFEAIMETNSGNGNDLILLILNSVSPFYFDHTYFRAQMTYLSAFFCFC